MIPRIFLLVLVTLVQACAPRGPVVATARPPADPIAQVSHGQLHARGLAYARIGDMIRAEQYLRAAMLKGHPEPVVVAELVKVCVAASRMRAALDYAVPYLRRYPHDVPMRYVVGTLYLSLGKLESAERAFALVRQARPDLMEMSP